MGTMYQGLRDSVLTTPELLMLKQKVSLPSLVSPTMLPNHINTNYLIMMKMNKQNKQ